MSLKKAILKTIEYSAGFGAKLGLEELKERLISSKVYGDEEIEKTAGLMIYDLRFVNKKNEKLKEAEKLTKEYLSKFEDILMVGVTGSVAAGQPKKNDDIDLLIITKRNRLWITRLMVRLVVKREGIPYRRYGVKQENNDFCFNLWLDEDSLRLPKDRQNLRNAMDVIMMKKILNRRLTYERLIGRNGWAKKYVATGYSKLKVGKVRRVGKEKSNYIKTLINYLGFAGQYLYMKPKMRGETVNLHQAFFHPVV